MLFSQQAYYVGENKKREAKLLADLHRNEHNENKKSRHIVWVLFRSGRLLRQLFAIGFAACVVAELILWYCKQ